MRASYAISHQIIEQFHQVRHIAAPDRLRGPRDLEALPCEDVFKSVEREVVAKFAGYDVSQQARTGKTFIDGCLWLLRRMDIGVFAIRLTACAGILFAHMMQTLEVAGKILNLPAFIRADLLARQTAARTCAFRLAQLIDMRRDGKIFKVGKIAPALRRFTRRNSSAGSAGCGRSSVLIGF